MGGDRHSSQFGTDHLMFKARSYRQIQRARDGSGGLCSQLGGQWQRRRQTLVTWGENHRALAQMVFDKRGQRTWFRACKSSWGNSGLW